MAADLKTALQIGENFYGPRELYKAIRMQASDLVMPDFMRIGGITGWLRAALPDDEMPQPFEVRTDRAPLTG